MRYIRSLLSELLGLFVDDGHLAVLSLFLFFVVSGLVKLLGVPALLGASLLLIGNLAILCWSAYRATVRP